MSVSIAIAAEPEASAQVSPEATLPGLLRLHATRHPNAAAIVASTNAGAVRLGFAALDRLVDTVAENLSALRLPAASGIAIPAHNRIETVVAMLAAMRADHTAVLLPPLWREDEAAATLAASGAVALVVTGATASDVEVARRLAAASFTIRFVCTLRKIAPDGLIALGAPRGATPQAPQSEATAAALVTFDTLADGHHACTRTHRALLAGGMAVASEAGLRPHARIASTLLPTGFANITATIVPWLVTGGTLELSDALAEAPRTGTSDADVTVLPGPLVVPFVEAGRLDASRGVVLSVWRAPERRPQNSTWPYAARLVDVLAFGEAGLVALRRLPDGGPAPLLPGPVHDTSGFSAISLRLSERGTLLVDGPMSPIEGKADAGLDTGIPCVMRTDGTLAVTGPPRGVVSVGGHRVAIDRLREALAGAAPDAVVAALPDRLTGQRLAASGLGSVEGHPLLNDAFRDRRP